MRNLRTLHPTRVSMPNEVIYELERERFDPGGSWTLTRGDIIDALIETDINVNGGEGNWYLAGLLRDGFQGYAKMSDLELMEQVETSGTFFAEGLLNGSDSHNLELDINAVIELACHRRNVEG